MGRMPGGGADRRTGSYLQRLPEPVLDDNRVVSKDEKLAQALGLETGRVYTVPVLLGTVEKNLTAEIFETSCHNCDWYAQGLCRYETLREKYRNRLR